jgi:hypothetical protein
MENQLPRVDYIVHLMLENRSCDQLLAFLPKPARHILQLPLA